MKHVVANFSVVMSTYPGHRGLLQPFHLHLLPQEKSTSQTDNSDITKHLLLCVIKEPSETIVKVVFINLQLTFLFFTGLNCNFCSSKTSFARSVGCVKKKL